MAIIGKKPTEDQEIQLHNGFIKALGLIWFPSQDEYTSILTQMIAIVQRLIEWECWDKERSIKHTLPFISLNIVHAVVSLNILPTALRTLDMVTVDVFVTVK